MGCRICWTSIDVCVDGRRQVSAPGDATHHTETGDTTMQSSTQHISTGAAPVGKATEPGTESRRSARIGRALWIAQVLLALVFLFAGAMKLVVPIADLTKQIPLPGAFLRFIGLCEFSGGLGLILPGLLRIRPNLTAIAAAGLVIIMSGATGISMAGGALAPALPPFVIGILAGLVAYGRSRIAPIQERPRAAARRPARRFAPAALYGLVTAAPDSAR